MVILDNLAHFRGEVPSFHERLAGKGVVHAKLRFFFAQREAFKHPFLAGILAEGQVEVAVEDVDADIVHEPAEEHDLQVFAAFLGAEFLRDQGGHAAVKPEFL